MVLNLLGGGSMGMGYGMVPVKVAIVWTDIVPSSSFKGEDDLFSMVPLVAVASFASSWLWRRCDGSGEQCEVSSAPQREHRIAATLRLPLP
jgi:hypothetical protein